MSKSFKKLLITGGCSWTSPNEPYYVAAGMTKVWPNYVADWFEWDLLNVGHGGASNDLIHNRVIDAIHQNEDRDIVVMCAWSQAMRLTLFDMPIAQMTFNVHMPDLEPPFGLTKTNCQKVMRELLQLHVHEYDPRFTLPPAVDGTLNGPHGISLEDHYRMIARWSIRNIYMLNDISICMLTLDNIKEKVYFEYRRAQMEAMKTERLGVIHVSDVIKPCMRNVVYNKITPHTMSTEDMKSLYFGQIVHSNSMIAKPENNEMFLAYNYVKDEPLTREEALKIPPEDTPVPT